jgi:hypothetical protein
MRPWGDLTGFWLGLLAAGAIAAAPAAGQEGSATESAPSDAAGIEASGGGADEGLLSAEEIDTLVGPVALFPDALLAQVLLSTTVPLDVMKADRFVQQSKDLSDDQRAEAAAKLEIDENAKALAAGFPSLVTRMAEHMDWTEQMGEAVLVQTDDVLASIQRLRAQAEVNGYLTDNAAQEVTQDETGAISIAPADPQVVYVPTYEPEVVYTTVAPATPYYVDSGNDWDDTLAAGAIFFGSMIILDEIFDDDDWGDWDDDWDGPNHIDWDRGDINVGDINIDRGDINIDRDNLNIDRDNLSIDRDRPRDRDRVADRDRDRDKIGAVDRDGLDRERDRSFKPDPASRDAARAKIENRKAAGARPATLPAPAKARPDAVAGRPAAKKPAAAARPATGTRPAAAKPAKVSKPKAAARPTAAKKPPRPTAMKKTGGSRASAASSRGKASRGGGGRKR